MKRLLLLTLAAAVAISLVTVMSVRSLGGSTDVAHAQVPQLALDLDGSGGWCSDIDATDSANVGEQHQAAICLLNSTTAAKNLDIVVLFNTQLNDCTNTGQSGTALDANPDFVGQGTGFDCSLGGLKFPYCKTNNNETPPVITSEAFITCGTTNNPGTLSGPEAVAVITWTVAAGGTDNLTFGVASVSDQNFEELVACPGANCIGATVTKTGNTPEPTATSTRLPTATATRECGGPRQEPCPTSTPTAKAKTRTPTPEATGTPAPGQPTSAPPPPPPPPSGGQQPVVVPPATGTGSGGIGWTGILMWTLAGGAASLVLGGGLYLRRVTNR